MANLWKRIKREMIELLPALAFFLLAFNIIVLTDALTTESYGIEPFSFLAATGAAIIVAKAVFVANKLPLMNAFKRMPRVYTTVWRASVYIIAAFLVRYLERMMEFWREYDGLLSANRHMLEQINWPRFWAIQIWFAVLFTMFAALIEITDALGPGRLRRLFFGPRVRRDNTD